MPIPNKKNKNIKNVGIVNQQEAWKQGRQGSMVTLGDER